MGWLRFLRRERRDRDFADEVSAHLAHEADEQIARGMSPDEARYTALRKLGNLTALKEAIHERNSLVRLEGLWKDLGYGARQMRRDPSFALVAVLSLGLGIGANTAIFSLLHQLLLRSLPLRNPDELIFLYHPGPLEGHESTDEPGGPSFSYPVFRALQEQETPFIGLAGARAVSVDLSHLNQAAPGQVHRVSGNYFEVLGVGAALGRVLSEGDDRTPGAHPVVVLSHRYWTTRFGGDVSVLNQTLLVNGYPMTIVGVAQKGFEGEYRRWTVDAFVPISMNRELAPGWDGFDDREDHWVTLLARLRPGVSREQAEAAIQPIYRAQLEEDLQRYGRRDKDFLERYRAKRILVKEGWLGRGGAGSETPLIVSLLMGITFLVLLICCTNVANLLLARGASRAREMSARLALGASRLRLVRQLLAEAALLGLGGAVLGLVIARWTLDVLLSAIPTRRAAGPLSSDLDGGVLLYCLSLSLASVLVFGLVPALRASRIDLVAALKQQSAQVGGGRPGRLLGRSLVTGQLAVSLLLLIVAGLFARTFVNLTRMELGIRADNLVTFSLQSLHGRGQAVPGRSSERKTALLYDRLRDRLAALPGVKLASFAQVPAIAGSSSSTMITVAGFGPPDDDASRCHYNEVGPDYFRALGIPLLVGREFSEADGVGAPKVAVVNEAFVRHFLPGRNPLGQRFARGVGDVVPDIEIVGVVKDAKYSSMREPPPRVFYTPWRQAPGGTGLHFYLRTASEPESLLAPVRSAVAALAPDLPTRDLKTMRRQIEENVAGERLVSGLTGAFGALATLLASVGLYGVMSYNVARRTREIGIRMALGAGAAQVRGLVLRDVAVMLLVGTALGVAAALGAGRLVESLLYEMKPWDPVVYVPAILVVALVALAAAYLPARRAARVDPIQALRYE